MKNPDRQPQAEREERQNGMEKVRKALLLVDDVCDVDLHGLGVSAPAPWCWGIVFFVVGWAVIQGERVAFGLGDWREWLWCWCLQDYPLSAMGTPDLSGEWTGEMTATMGADDGLHAHGITLGRGNCPVTILGSRMY